MKTLLALLIFFPFTVDACINMNRCLDEQIRIDAQNREREREEYNQRVEQEIKLNERFRELEREREHEERMRQIRESY